MNVYKTSCKPHLLRFVLPAFPSGPQLVIQLMMSLRNAFLLSSTMQTKRLLINCIFALFTLASSTPTAKRDDCACTNGPDTRSCWTPGFDVSVNRYSRFPDTGKTVQVMSYALSNSYVLEADP